MAQFLSESEQTEEISPLPETDTPQETPEVPTEAEELPERYRGKDPKELIRMHQEAEKLMGRHSKEVGELRRIVDDFVKAQTVTSQPQQDEDIDFFSDPKGAVEQAVSRHPKIKEAEVATAQLAKAQALQSLQKAHPDFQDILNDEGFNEWVGKSKVRSELLSRADQRFDFDAADDLFSTWKERKEMVSNAAQLQQQDRKQQLKQASTGSAKGSGETGSGKIYRRADIIDLMQKNPDRYMLLQPDIMRAYAENRVR
jgi:hypothetical protein